MRDDQDRQKSNSGHFTADSEVSGTEQGEYAYQDSGIKERHGTIPIWLILVAILLVFWGVYYTVQNWSPPLPVY